MYDAVYEQLDALLELPDSHAFAVENDTFPYEIREKLVGAKKRTFRAIFTIAEQEVRVLTVRRGSQHALRPDEILE